MSAPANTPPAPTRLDRLLTTLTEGQETVFDIAKDGKSLAVTLKRLEPDPPKPLPRLETARRAHAFLEAAGFAAYLARYGTQGDVVVYADPAQERMWATLAECSVGGRETVTFAPQVHPLFAPWLALVARGRVALAEFRDHVAQNKRCVRTPTGAALALLLAQLRGAREVTIHDGRGKDSLNGVVVKTTVQGVEGKDVVPIPSEIVIHVPLYVGGEPQDVPLDLVLDVNARNEVTVQVAAGTVGEARVLAFDHMLASIREALAAKDATVTYGQPAEQPWSYLRP